MTLASQECTVNIKRIKEVIIIREREREKEREREGERQRESIIPCVYKIKQNFTR